MGAESLVEFVRKSFESPQMKGFQEDWPAQYIRSAIETKIMEMLEMALDLNQGMLDRMSQARLQELSPKARAEAANLKKQVVELQRELRKIFNENRPLGR